MKVVVTRSGGFAGIRVSWQVVIDDLPDASDWFVLLRDLPWDQVAAQKPQPDRFVYRIRFEPPTDAEPPEPEREATLAERQLTGPWRELVEKVQDADTPPDAAPAPATSSTHSGEGHPE